jgi:hypothetical protein
MKTKIITLAIVTCCWACLNQAQAVPITIEITGVVADGYGSIWGGALHVGSVFSGTYTYDSTAPNTSTHSEFGKYVFDSPYGMDFFVGGYEFKTATNQTGGFTITVSYNGQNGNYYKFESNQNAPLSNGAVVDTIFWRVQYYDSTISSTNLPTIAPILNEWSTTMFSILGFDTYGKTYLIEGPVTQAVLIPEPLTGVLMIVGVFLLRRRKQVFVA